MEGEGGGTEQAGVAPAAFRGEENRVFPFPLLPNGRARCDRRLADTCSRPAAAGGRLAPPGQSVFGKTQRTNGSVAEERADNVSRHRMRWLKNVLPFCRRVMSSIPAPRLGIFPGRLKNYLTYAPANCMLTVVGSQLAFTHFRESPNLGSNTSDFGFSLSLPPPWCLLERMLQRSGR